MELVENELKVIWHGNLSEKSIWRLNKNKFF